MTAQDEMRAQRDAALERYVQEAERREHMNAKMNASYSQPAVATGGSGSSGGSSGGGGGGGGSGGRGSREAAGGASGASGGESEGGESKQSGAG